MYARPESQYQYDNTKTSGSCEHDIETCFVRDKQATSKVADNKMKSMKYRASWPHI
jgi:hypothetical protein